MTGIVNNSQESEQDEREDSFVGEASREVEQIAQTLPSLKGQLIKWLIRSLIAYGLAQAFIAWRGGPDWLMPITYLYIAISLIFALVIWWVSFRMITKVRRSVDETDEMLRDNLDEIDSGQSTR
ncbi:hypothetical protein [Polycladidibacter stylochi]|uniref:hypothetical protein n=1 Tax=Polycladidibacter stylochi TaxID=1807766 RepID=UPI00082EEA9F|nr:hypothetical protein [Pseudovibrio stylochi]